MNQFKIGALVLAITVTAVGCADMSEAQKGNAMGTGA